MTINTLLLSDEIHRQGWRPETRSHYVNAKRMTSQWRVNPSLSSPDSLKRSQEELGLLFKSGHSSRAPQSIARVQALINSATSLHQLCKALGLAWIARLSPEYDGSIGHLGSSSWGLVIEGEEGETNEYLAYTEGADIVCIETLPELTRPQIIIANISIETLTKEGVL